MVEEVEKRSEEEEEGKRMRENLFTSPYDVFEYHNRKGCKQTNR